MRTLLSNYFEYRENIFPPYRKKALWEHMEPLRRLWDERYYATEAGEALLLAIYFRIEAAKKLQKQGMKLAGRTPPDPKRGYGL